MMRCAVCTGEADEATVVGDGYLCETCAEVLTEQLDEIDTSCDVLGCDETALRDALNMPVASISWRCPICRVRVVRRSAVELGPAMETHECVQVRRG